MPAVVRGRKKANMTREKWKQMTPDQQRIKVAELCGWKRTTWAEQGYKTSSVDALVWINPEDHLPHGVGDYGDDRGFLPFPDYLDDLGAMREAEDSHLPRKKRRIWISALADICEADHNPIWVCYLNHALQYVLSSTAAQRAEALALTLEPE